MVVFSRMLVGLVVGLKTQFPPLGAGSTAGFSSWVDEEPDEDGITATGKSIFVFCLLSFIDLNR